MLESSTLESLSFELPALEPPALELPALLATLALEPALLEPLALEPSLLEPSTLEPPALEAPTLEPPALELPALDLPALLEPPVLEAADVPVVAVVKAEDTFSEVAAEEVDRLAPSTSETPLGAPLPAPVVLGITDDFSTTELCPDTALGSMLDDLATDDLAIDFGSSLIMRSGFSGTPKNLEPSRLPSVLPPSAVSALSSSLDTLVSALLGEAAPAPD